MASHKKHSGTELDEIQPMVNEILSFSCYAILSNGPLGGHLGLSISINMKWFHSGTIVIDSGRKTFMFSGDIGI